MAVPSQTHRPEYLNELSMREKSLYKRKVVGEHNSNFRTSYIYAEDEHGGEQHLQKTGMTGIRGRKRCLLCLLVTFMIVTAIANLLLSAAIICVLHFDLEGMQAIDMISPSVVTRFRQDAEFDSMAPYTGSLDSLRDEDLTVTGAESKVKVEVDDNSYYSTRSHFKRKEGVSMSVDSDGIQVVADDGFHVTSPDGKPVFTTDDQTLHMPWVQNVSHIEVTELVTPKISSPKGDSLHLESDGDATIQGMLGLRVNGNQVVIVAQDGVHFRSQGTGLKMASPQGVYFEKVENFRKSSGKKPRKRVAVGGNSLCICGNNGRVFMVPDKGRGLGCANANERLNPCE